MKKFYKSKVLIAIDRLMGVLILRWKRLFRAKQAALASTGVFFFFMFLNSNVLFLYGVEIDKNGTQVFLCYSNGDESTVWIETWTMVSYKSSYC